MALSYYATTRPGALSVAMNSSTTVVPLVSAATFPDPAGPGNGEYTVIIGYGSDREEVCTVTAKVGDSLTVIRGQDSTAATGKNQGDVVVHGVSARDFETFSQVGDQPTAHAASHASAGIDPVTPAAIGAATPAQLAAAVPIGTIFMWGGATVPNANWHLCDGTVHGSSALQAAIGSANTPDLRGLFIVGAGVGANSDPATGSTTVYPQGTGAKAGKEAVTLAVAQIPGHAHGAVSNAGFGGGPNVAGWTVAGAVAAQSFNFAETGAQGGGLPHENRPPYYAVTLIIKKA